MKTFYRLIQGDCLKILKGFDENSIDCTVTDPPYGISFMGKSWDKALPPKEAFKEMFRVLKPGALAFIMSSPRQDVLWRMMSLLEGVGFELRQSPIYWTYASGFPKAYDVSKGIDKKLGKKRKVIGKGEAGYQVSISKTRKKQGYRPNLTKATTIFNLTEPSSEDAKKWSGWKSQTGLKPAVEIVLMVNKPRSERTIVDNVLKWGTGAINVDECRIPFKSEKDKEVAHNNALGPVERFKTYKMIYDGGKKSAGFKDTHSSKGRFPANLLVSDDVLDTGKIHKSGKIEPHHIIKKDENGYSVQEVYGKYTQLTAEHHISYGDSGGFSRFFSLDAWWLNRIKKLPRDIQKTFPFLIVPKASKSERDKGLGVSFPIKEADTKFTHGITPEKMLERQNNPYSERAGSWQRPKARNTHPTVKPLKLMSYLITLGCPPNGTVLDPFLGSGTTMLAAILMNKSCVGIEINPEYCDIAKARCFNRNMFTMYASNCKFEVAK